MTLTSGLLMHNDACTILIKNNSNSHYNKINQPNTRKKGNMMSRDVTFVSRANDTWSNHFNDLLQRQS